MSKTITDNEFIYYFQENCSENIALQIDYSFKEIGFISIFKSAYIKHKGKIPTDKLLKICPIFDAKDAVEFHAFICKFCEIKRGFFVQERFDKVIKKIIEKSNKSKASITARWNKGKTLKGDTNDYTNVSTNDYTKDKVKVKVKVKVKEEKKENFKKLVYENKEIGNEALEEFFDYWSEKNKDGSKMRFEKEKTFEISRRLKIWMKNKEKWNKSSGTATKNYSTKVTPELARALDFAEARTELGKKLGMNPARIPEEQLEQLRNSLNNTLLT